MGENRATADCLSCQWFPSLIKYIAVLVRFLDKVKMQWSGFFKCFGLVSFILNNNVVMFTFLH